MKVRELNPSSNHLTYPRDTTCPTCATFARHLVHYLNTPSPFPSLTCLSVFVPSTSQSHEKPDRCKEILSRLFGRPGLRHVIIVDPWFSGILHLPAIPSKLRIELNLHSDLKEGRMKEYLALLESVRALRCQKCSELRRAMLEQWAPSLHYLRSAATRPSLEVSGI